MSWERLTMLAQAHERRAAKTMIQFMIAAQGQGDCWKAQVEALKKLLTP